jgi:hypothetical protein
MKTISELKAKAVTEGRAVLYINGNEYVAIDVRGKVFVSFNGKRMAADQAQTVLDFDNYTVETECDDKGVHCTGHVDYDPASVISTAEQLKDLAPGRYTVTGEAALTFVNRDLENLLRNNRPIAKVSVRVVNVAARRLREELASLRVKHGYRVVSDENGLRYEATKLVRPAVVLRIAKLKRLLDMANGRKPGLVWLYEIENGGRHYGFSDNWIRKPKFHGWTW